MNRTAAIITKASGQQVSFSEEKLKQSLRRSGAGQEVIDAIAAEVKDRVYDGITTRKIYKLAFGLLKKYSKPFAAKYKLKAAILELGPSGYPFERYFAEILKHNGYSIKVGEIVRGRCVNHEIDVIAEKEDQQLMVECKYHQTQGVICSVKIPLYVEARFRDLEVEWKKIPGQAEKFHQGWVVTNTRFSSDAIQYGTCAGLHLVGWNFPVKGSLNNLVDQSRLYPLTCLTTLTKYEKQVLLDHNIVLCREICTNPAVLKLASISEARIKNILEESNFLCKGLRD